MRWRQQPALANHAEFLALLLGLVLTSFSLPSPLVRSLNLLLSSLTLAVVIQKRAVPQAALIYATHITGLTAIASGMDLLLPNLEIRDWTMILLGGMVAEWSFSVGSNWQLWRRSAWHIGLGLAAISYSLLLTEAVDPSDGSVWSLIGLTIPVTLTAIASYPQFHGSCFNKETAILEGEPFGYKCVGLMATLGNALGLSSPTEPNRPVVRKCSVRE